MPRGMLLRSAWSASSIADPSAALTLDAYKHFSGNHLSAPVSLERFVDYGLWFQRAIVPDMCPARISSVRPNHRGFHLTLADGRVTTASRVIVAAGLSAFAFRPPEFANIPVSLAPHTSEQHNLRAWLGKRVAVIGGGQSALESAALLQEAGAEVELFIRRSRVHWLGWKQKIQKIGLLSRALFSPEDVGPAALCWLVAAPSLVATLPKTFQEALRNISLRPAGARWLIERLRPVKITTGTRVSAAAPCGDSLKLTLSDGSERIVHHALLGTGYHVDIARYPFLSPELTRRIQTSDGSPKLAPGLESSVPGLHFLGAPAAWTFGPLMYFVSGTAYAAGALLRCFKKRGALQ
jgi:FAD-dependent urate hydroxylase